MTRGAAAAAITVIAVALAGYTLYMGVDPREVLSISPRNLAAATAMYTFAWLVSAYRLRLIDHVYSGRVHGLRHYFNARLLGGLAAYITPSAIGGEPARAYYLARLHGGKTAEYFAVALYEVYFDVLFTAAAALVLSIPLLPLSLPVLLVSLGTMAAWIPLPHVIRRGSGRLYDLFVKRLPREVKEQFTFFVEGYMRLYRGCGRLCVALLTLLTLIYHLLNALTILLLCWPMATVYEAFAGYIYALSLGALPTPGGAGAAEYGLTLVFDPRTVVQVRGFMIAYTVLVGLAVLQVSRGTLFTLGEETGAS